MGSLVMDLLAGLPKGEALAEPAWNARHRGILSILWLHVPGVPMFGIYMGASPALYLGGGGYWPSSPSPHDFPLSADVSNLPSPPAD
jgi:hypothetical protein